MRLKNYYKILGVEKTSTSEEIRKAYHKLAKKYHPDLNQNDLECLIKFQSINEAYKVLGTLENRLQYSILLNKALLDEKLLHKNFPIPESIKKKKKRFF
jgi:DnaJ-class molecular chaperone